MKYIKSNNYIYCQKNVSHLEKWVTLGKMANTGKSGSHLEKWIKLGKMSNTFPKNGS